ncbi:MAG: hypothetical protein ACT4O3_08925, partial [Elusimicrobiota bacterium]
GPLKSLFQLRAFLGGARRIILRAGVRRPTPPVAAAGLRLRRGAELLERHLFFVAAAPPQMPGPSGAGQAGVSCQG